MLLIAGGDGDGGAQTHPEVYPPNTSCSPPPSVDRDSPSLLMTYGPTGPLIAMCGGYFRGDALSSCLTLDLVHRRWDEGKMGDLTMVRRLGAVARLDNIGVFVVGGDWRNNQRSSDFLSWGSLEWEEGPSLPIGKPLSEMCCYHI